MNRLNTLAVATLVTFATACGNTAEGVGKDAENAGDKIENATDRAAGATATSAESAGSGVNAAMETGDVKTALLADSRISADNINVDSNGDAKTVTLNGTVPTQAQKQIAEEIAKAKAPEWKVVNNLTIKPD